MKKSWLLAFLSMLSLPAFAAQASSLPPPIHVPSEFRQTPIWYWQSPEKKCVPIPSADVISRVAPARVRKEHLKGSKARCEINVDARQIIAELTCDGQLLTEYFSNEQLCKEKLRIKEASVH